MSRVPFSWRLGHPVSPVRFVMEPGGHLHFPHQPRPLFDATPRRVTPSKRSGCLLPRRNPYVSGGWLLRARLDRGSVTPPHGRYCLGTRTPFRPFLQRLSLTWKALESARPTEPVGAEAPSWYGRSQRPSRFLRPNQLAGRCAANFMSPFSYESTLHAIQKAAKQCFFSSTHCPQDYPQLVPANERLSL